MKNWKTATSDKRTATGRNPQTLPEALRLAAELAEQKQLLEQKAHQLNQQLVAAAKVDFADRVSVAKGILIGNFAKVVGLKQNALFARLRENGILIASEAVKCTVPAVHQRGVFHGERSGAG